MTIYEIAEQAGVSITTVSRVINNPSIVSDTTRKKVQEILDRNNYHPNGIARGLTQNSMKNIGILTADIQLPHFSATTHYLEDAFYDMGYSILLCLAGNEAEKKKSYIRTLAAKHVDGLVLTGSLFSSQDILNELNRYLPDIPVVAINHPGSGPNMHTVSVDHEQGIRLLFEHLLAGGRRRFFFVRATESRNTLRKAEAFRKQILEQKLWHDENDNIIVLNSDDPDFKAFADDVSKNLRPGSAYIFHDEPSAAKAVAEFRKLGLNIPSDVAVACFDNTPLSTYLSPSLTVIDTKIATLAYMAADTLKNILDHKEVSRSTVISPDLIIRETT